MSNMDAWQWILNNWHCNNWQAIPQIVKDTIKLDSRVGMFNGMLITKVSADGVNEFTQKMNRAR